MRADPTSPDNDREFAEALREAIASSSLGLARIQRRLSESGASVSLATLSYWQSGRSVPARPASLRALTELERMLGLTNGQLAQLLPRRGNGEPLPDVHATLAATAGDGTGLPEPLAQLDARAGRSLDVVSEHFQTSVGPNRAQHSRRSRRIMRARADGVDQFILTDVTADTSPGPPIVAALMHCRAGETHSVTGGAVTLTQMQLDRSLNKGESIMVEYQLDYPAPESDDPSSRDPNSPHSNSPESDSPESAHRLQLRGQLRELMLEVCFHPDARPTRCEWFDGDSSDTDGGERTQALEVNTASCVLVVRHDLTPGTYGVRWFWA